MQEKVKKLYSLGLLVPLLAIIIAFSPLSRRRFVSVFDLDGRNDIFCECTNRTEYQATELSPLMHPVRPLLCMPPSQGRLSGEAYPTGIASPA